MRSLFAAAALVALGSLVLGCDSKNPDDNEPPVAKTETAPAAPKIDSGPMETIDSTGKKWTFTDPHVQTGDIAVVETTKGTIKFALFDDKAPGHVASFEKLANAGFYDGTAFHRVKPGFMIQGGDPNTRGVKSGAFGAGGPGYTLKAEFNDTPFDRGIVGMARSQDPDSAGSQFYIMVGPTPSLNNQYTAFGKVTDGMAVADSIAAVKTTGPQADQVVDIDQVRIKSVKIIHPAASNSTPPAPH